MSKKKSNEVQAKIQKLLVKYAEEANEWTQFSERDTEINAVSFVQTLVLGWLKKGDASLNELAHSAKDLGIKTSASALHERINLDAVMLLASVVQLALENLREPCPLQIEQLSQFEGIYITDSTQIALPSALAHIFRGAKSNAIAKLQVTWDYLNGNLAAIEVEDGRSADQKCKLHVSHAQAGTLQLFDLGYFKQEYLRDIDEQDAYFVSRYQSQTSLYQTEDVLSLDLVAWLKTLKSNEANIPILLGGRTKHPLRLVVRRLSKKVADARRRKARKKAKKNGQTASKRLLFLQAWDILLTNLPEADWSIKQLFDLYGIRFQIEWIFRIWKDQMDLDYCGNWRIERVLVQLYAHLLGATLAHILTANWRWDSVEFSFFKCVQIIQKATQRLMRCLARQGYGLSAWMKQLQDDFRQFGLKSKRRKSPSTLQIVNNWGLS